MIGTIFLLIGLLFDRPDSVDVILKNDLENNCISRVDMVLPGAERLYPIVDSLFLQPDQSTVIRLPWGFVNRIILSTTDGKYFYINQFLASSDPDTALVSLANSEFGGVFDRVFGCFPVVIENNSDAILTSANIVPPYNSSFSTSFNNPVLPGEVIRFWLPDSSEYTLTVTERSGLCSVPLQVTPKQSSLYSLDNTTFLSDLSSLKDYSLNTIVVCNCIYDADLIDIYVFDSLGYVIGYLDYSSNPLSTWEYSVIDCATIPAFIECIDQYNRSYSLISPNQPSGFYEFSLHSLDFNFNFYNRMDD